MAGCSKVLKEQNHRFHFSKTVSNSKCFTGIILGQVQNKENQDQVQERTYQSKYQHHYISRVYKSEDNDLESQILSKNQMNFLSWELFYTLKRTNGGQPEIEEPGYNSPKKVKFQDNSLNLCRLSQQFKQNKKLSQNTSAFIQMSNIYYFKAFCANSFCSEVTRKQIKYTHLIITSYNKKLARTVCVIKASNSILQQHYLF